MKELFQGIRKRPIQGYDFEQPDIVITERWGFKFPKPNPNYANFKRPSNSRASPNYASFHHDGVNILPRCRVASALRVSLFCFCVCGCSQKPNYA